ncbi:MAG: hypothetical protein ACI9OU_002667 [Candidatus Promineifilaceae bacterium]|jgi:hypothetical protein
MKKPRRYIFLDDGYPESRDFDTNYIEYDPTDTGDVNAACKTRLKPRRPSEAHWFSGDGYVGFSR